MRAGEAVAPFGGIPWSTEALARQTLACLDLTTLNEHDTADDVLRLCERADQAFGHVAAICVWPRFAALARASLNRRVAVAAVANFPAGGSDPAAALRDVAAIVDAGAQEVDLVLPWRALLEGRERAVSQLLDAARLACPGLVLKVILETGMLPDAGSIARAARLALDAGADFLKTSTGKVSVGATPDAAQAILLAIAAHPTRAAQAGFKASGGVRGLKDAAQYLALVQAHLGADALHPSRCRIGASSLMGEIEQALRP
jgi:deoxyribose-phosphate aldolase